MATQLRGKLLHEVAHLTKVIIIVELATASSHPLKSPKAQQRDSPVMVLGKGSAYKIFCIEIPQNLKILLHTTWLQSLSES